MNNQLAVRGERALIPAQVAAAGEGATRRFIEFFTANIRNRNTRPAYARGFGLLPLVRGPGLRELGASSRCMSRPTSSSWGSRTRRRASSSIWRRCACCSTGWWSARWSAQPCLGGAGAQAHRQPRQDADPLARGSASRCSRASRQTAWSGFAIGRSSAS